MSHNSNPSPQCNSNPGVLRPGITGQSLVENEIQLVTTSEAQIRCGCPEPGLAIPYRDLRDNKLVPLFDPEHRRFCRLRKSSVTKGRKYHQPHGTSVHAFFPVNLLDLKPAPDDLAFVEGEFKAISHSDRHAGFARHAIGLSGFFGYHLGNKDGEELRMVPELQAMLQCLQPKRILFIGDNDTAFNYEFFRAVVRLKQMLPDIALALPRIPLDQTKGLDDCRHEHGQKYELWFLRLVDEAVAVDAEDTVESLALRIAVSALGYVPKMCPVTRARTDERIVCFAAQLPESFREEFLGAAKKVLGLGITEFRKRVRRCADEESAKRQAEVESRIRDQVKDYFIAPRGRYFRLVGSAVQSIPTREDVLLSLRAEKGLTGPVARVGCEANLGLNIIQRDNSVSWAGRVAGNRAGLRGEGQNRLLITGGPTILDGQCHGDATSLVEMLADLMGRDADEPYFLQQFWTLVAWLKRRRIALRNPDAHLPTPVLVCVGASENGAYLAVEHIFAPLLGGQTFDPSIVWAARTLFNEAVVGAELLHISEPAIPADDVRGACAFKSALLRAVTDEKVGSYEKFLPAQQLRPIQGVVVTMNPTADGFRLLPLADRHAQAKIILLQCHPIRNLPGGNPEEHRRFFCRREAELASLAGQLDEIAVPEEFGDDGFGVAAFRHPALLAAAGVKDVSLALTRMLGQLSEERGSAEGQRLTAHAFHDLLTRKFGKPYLEIFADPRALGKGFMALRRDVPGWSGRLAQDGKVGYGSQGNYATVWRLKPAENVGS